MPHKQENFDKNRALCLRRVGISPSLPQIGDFFRLKIGTTVIGRNPAKSDIFLDSAVHKALISRLHARITTNPESHKVTICDTSLNGTYVNDKKILDTAELQLGDVITFGHLKGAVLEPGTVARQCNSEFQFKLEQYSLADNSLSYSANEMQDFLPDLSPFLVSTKEDNSIKLHQSTNQSQVDENVDSGIDIQKSINDMVQMVDDGYDSDKIYPKVTIRSSAIEYIEDSDDDDSDEIYPKVTIRSSPIEYIKDGDDGDDNNATNNRSAGSFNDHCVHDGDDYNDTSDEISVSIKQINSAQNLDMGETTTKSVSLNSMNTSGCTANINNKIQTIANNHISIYTDHSYTCKVNEHIVNKDKAFKNDEITESNSSDGFRKQPISQDGSIILENKTDSMEKQPISCMIDPLDIRDSRCDDDELVAYAIAVQDQLDNDLSDSELFCADVPYEKFNSANSSTSTMQTSLTSNDSIQNRNGWSNALWSTSILNENAQPNATCSRAALQTSVDITYDSILNRNAQPNATSSSPSRASFFRKEGDINQCSPLAIDAYGAEDTSLKRSKRVRPPGKIKKQKTPQKTPSEPQATKPKAKSPKIPISNEKNVPDTCGFMSDCLRPHDRKEYVDWVQCDYCKKWFHLECTGLALDTVNNNAVEFNCGCVYAE